MSKGWLFFLEGSWQMSVTGYYILYIVYSGLAHVILLYHYVYLFRFTVNGFRHETAQLVDINVRKVLSRFL